MKNLVSAAQRLPKELPVSLALVLACCLSVLAHAPSLGPSFVWDDRLLIDGPLVQTLHPIQEYFSTSFWTPSDTSPEQRMYFRPLSTLSLALDFHVHGANATGFHVTNLALHGACAVFVFLLARRLGASAAGSLAGTLFFGWFPRSTESVAWISGRTDLLATLPALAALLATMSRMRGRRWIAAALVFIALLSKEVSLAAACGIGVYELAQKGALRSKALSLAPLGLALASFGCLRAAVIGVLPRNSAAPFGARTLTALEAAARYFWLLIDGWQPRLQIGSPADPDLRLVVLGALVLLGVALGVTLGLVGKLRLAREQAALLVTAAGAIALVLHVIPIHVNVVAADRFLYLPIACLGAVLGGVLSAHWSARSGWLVGALLVSYLSATLNRAADWGDDIRFWTTATREQRGANNAMSRVGLANVLSEHGLYDEALRTLRTAGPADARNYIVAQHNLAGLLAVEGRLEEACAVTERTLRLFDLPGLYTKLATLRAALNQAPAARTALEKYARLVRDPLKVRQAQQEVDLALQLGEELRRTGGTQAPSDAALGADLEARLERVRTLLRLQILDVAFKEAVPLLQDRRVGAARARHLLLLGIDQAGPDELRQIHRAAKAMDPDFPAALDTVVVERLARSLRLEAEMTRLWHELELRGDI